MVTIYAQIDVDNLAAWATDCELRWFGTASSPLNFLGELSAACSGIPHDQDEIKGLILTLTAELPEFRWVRWQPLQDGTDPPALLARLWAGDLAREPRQTVTGLWMVWPHLMLSDRQQILFAEMARRFSQADPHLGKAVPFAVSTEILEDNRWLDNHPIEDAQQPMKFNANQLQAWGAGFIAGFLLCLSLSMDELQELPNGLQVTVSEIENGSGLKNQRQDAIGGRHVWPFSAVAALGPLTAENEPNRNPTLALFALNGYVRPNVEISVLVGDTFRRALIKKYLESEAMLPPDVTGHDGTKPATGHQHPYFLSEDMDADGLIDHLLVFAPTGISHGMMVALEKIEYLHRFKLNVRLESIGREEITSHETSLVGPSSVWVSATPYLHPWHHKKHGKFGPEEQIKKELTSLNRGFPELRVVKKIASPSRTRSIHRGEFRRFRDPNHLGPDRIGSYWLLTFAHPLTGPLSLGFECHYGLGLFVPETQQ